MGSLPGVHPHQHPQRRPRRLHHHRHHRQRHQHRHHHQVRGHRQLVVLEALCPRAFTCVPVIPQHTRLVSKSVRTVVPQGWWCERTTSPYQVGHARLSFSRQCCAVSEFQSVGDCTLYRSSSVFLYSFVFVQINLCAFVKRCAFVHCAFVNRR